MGTGGGGRKRARSARDSSLISGVRPVAPGGFVIDRLPTTREDLANKNAKDARAMKRAMRRGIVKPRRSEVGAEASGDGGARERPGTVRGKKKKQASVDEILLEKRVFGRTKERVVTERGDVWESELAGVVKGEKSVDRKKLEVKMNGGVAKSMAVLRPDDGLSVNPMLEAHQDALGEAVGEEIARRDEARWDEERMKFDPKVLLDKPLHVAQDGSEDEVENGSAVNGDIAVEQGSRKFGKERLTRRDKSKASRKRSFEALRVRRATAAKIAEQLEDLEKVDAEAAKESEHRDGADAEAEKKMQLAAIEADGEDAAAAKPLHKSLGGVQVPTERDLNKTAVPLSGDLSTALRSVGMSRVNPLVRDRFLAFQRRGLIEPPKVIMKERKQAVKDRIREEQRDKMVRKGRGSRSNMTYWRKTRKR